MAPFSKFSCYGKVLFSALFLYGMLGAPLVAQPITSDLPLSYSRPGDSGTPTEVSVGVYVIDILAIDDVERTITLDYYIFFRWSDPRLSDANYQGWKKKSELEENDIWTPQINEFNLRRSTSIDSILKIDPDGNVFVRARSIDTFTAPLDLRRFPFDQQVIELRFRSTQYNKQQIKVAWNTERGGHPSKFSLPGWRLKEINHRIVDDPIEGLDEERTGFDLNIHMIRDSDFYVWKVYVPLGLIAFMAWTVFWIDPANFQGQIAISSASVITLIAFQMSLSDLLPPISYLTEIDVYALGTSFLVFLALGESTLTSRLAKANREDLGRSIDVWMRWIYPILFCLIILVSVL